MNLSLELIGQVPEDAQLLRAAQMRQPVTDAFADAASALRGCADILLREAYPGDDGFAEFAHRLLASARSPGPSN